MKKLILFILIFLTVSVFCADKTFKNFSTVAGGTMNDVVTHPEVVPNGAIWVIKRFLAGDINYGDNMSSVYGLRFGTEILSFFVHTGSSSNEEMNIQIIGNGVDSINVLRQNYSSQTKRLPFRAEIIELE